MDWAEIDARPEDLVVIVGAGEVGPVGSSRTRFQLEVEDHLSAAGVLELAWTTGLITWETQPVAGWSDAASGEQLTESEVVEKYAAQLEASVGIRRYRDDDQMIDNSAPLMVSVYLEQDTSFVVRTRDEADAFVEADPERTRIAPTEDGDWLVTRLAGSQMRVPRRFKLSRFVGAQIPDGFDPAVWGLGSMVESVDRLAAWNLVATVDAFVSSGVTPAELLRWVHPTQFANTQGTGIGGMESTRKMYVDALLGEQPPNDVLQEALPNVIAAHTVQSYLGGYGAMVHPVAACATAAVSVEEGVDKIKLGKASVVVAGGFDDLGIEGILGFGNMSATADTAQMLAKGIEERHVCRPNDRRRGGFVEGQGGGTVVLARGDVAAELGLPVLGVVAYAGSFADGIHTSIPAPGLGALGAGVGGAQSPLAKGLATIGLGADDVAVVSKHDTSTAANDPNESQLHEKLAGALGRTTGSPLFVVSQKSLTGHAKGGAAAFQMIGLCQLLAGGTVPPNRGLDCVDEALSVNEHLVWLRQSLQTGPLKVGLLTSLGFGHVSAMVAVAHPGAFVAALSPEQRESWLQRATRAPRLRRGSPHRRHARRRPAVREGRAASLRQQRRRAHQGRRERDARRPAGATGRGRGVCPSRSLTRPGLLRTHRRSRTDPTWPSSGRRGWASTSSASPPSPPSSRSRAPASPRRSPRASVVRRDATAAPPPRRPRAWPPGGRPRRQSSRPGRAPATAAPRSSTPPPSTCVRSRSSATPGAAPRSACAAPSPPHLKATRSSCPSPTTRTPTSPSRSSCSRRSRAPEGARRWLSRARSARVETPPQHAG